MGKHIWLVGAAGVGASLLFAATPAEAAGTSAAMMMDGPTCAPGFVWREARGDDFACVTPEQRAMAWSENSDAPRRWINGAYGPHTCVSGFVWREAYAGDDVCVTPDRRSAVQSENGSAPVHVAGTVPPIIPPVIIPIPPSGGMTPPVILPIPIGPARCANGYVWREAGPNDRVCVVPESRARAAAENNVAPSRWVSGGYGPRTCVGGFVWREAFAGDQVCVTPETRESVRAENESAGQRAR